MEQANHTREPPSPGSRQEAGSQSSLAEAKQLFAKGNALRHAEDYQGALRYYLQSRVLHPSIPNTLNAAFCLKQLKRYDEALELYEAALVDFQHELTEANREELARELALLRAETATLEVNANVSGILVIDGRERGRLPLPGPVRVLPGERSIRILKDGYQSFERKLTFKKRQKQLISASLKPLGNIGRLRVESSSGAGGTLYIDGAPVGEMPWEGNLGPGRHLIHAERDDQGSAPKIVQVIAGRTATANVVLSELGPRFRISVEPPGAVLEVNGVDMMSSSWQGRLPVGHYRVSASAEGYLPLQQSLEVTRARADAATLRLKVDATHPRWANSLETDIWLEANAGLALASTLGSGAEEQCACSQPGFGPQAGLRLVVGLGRRFSLGAGGGWLSLKTELDRRIEDNFGSDAGPVPITYHYHDRLSVQGAFLTLSGSYHLSLGDVFDLEGRLQVGAWIANASDSVTGEVTSASERVALRVLGSGDSTTSTVPLLWPGLYGNARIGNFRVSFGVGAFIVVVEGDALPVGEAFTNNTVDCNQTESIECVRGNKDIAGERSFGPMVALTPTLGIGYLF